MKNPQIIIVICVLGVALFSCSNKMHHNLSSSENNKDPVYICNYFENSNPVYDEAILNFRDSIKNESGCEYLYYTLTLHDMQADTVWIELVIDPFAAQFFSMIYGDRTPYIFDVEQKYGVFARDDIFNQVFIKTANIQKKEYMFKTKGFIHSFEEVKKEYRSSQLYLPSMIFAIYNNKIVYRDFKRYNLDVDSSFPWE